MISLKNRNHLEILATRVRIGENTQCRFRNRWPYGQETRTKPKPLHNLRLSRCVHPVLAERRRQAWRDGHRCRAAKVRESGAPGPVGSRKCAPWKGVDFQWVQFPPGDESLQPVAIGAAEEVTSPSKPLMQRIAVGDPASMQAETRVNAEQASKDQNAGADLSLFQGRPSSCGEEATRAPTGPAGVVASACMRQGNRLQHGKPHR